MTSRKRVAITGLGLVTPVGNDVATTWDAVVHASPLVWGCVVFLAWGATLFGFASWAALLHRYPTGLISPFALLIPVSGLASGALFLGESLAAMQVAGVLLVLAGLVVNVYGARIKARLT